MGKENLLLVCLAVVFVCTRATSASDAGTKPMEPGAAEYIDRLLKDTVGMAEPSSTAEFDSIPSGTLQYELYDLIDENIVAIVSDEDPSHSLVKALGHRDAGRLSDFFADMQVTKARPVALLCKRFMDEFKGDTRYGECSKFARYMHKLEKFVAFAKKVCGLVHSMKAKASLTSVDVNEIGALRDEVTKSLSELNDDFDGDRQRTILTSVPDILYRAHVQLRGMLSEILVDKVYTYKYEEIISLGMQAATANEAYEAWELAGFPGPQSENAGTLRKLAAESMELCEIMKRLYRNKVTNQLATFDCLRATYKDVLPILLKNTVEAWGGNQYIFSVTGLGVNHDEPVYVTITEEEHHSAGRGSKGAFSGSLPKQNEFRIKEGLSVVPEHRGMQSVVVDILPKSPFEWMDAPEENQGRSLMNNLETYHFETNVLESRMGCLNFNIDDSGSADCDSLATKYFERMNKSPLCARFTGNGLINMAMGVGSMLRVYQISVQDAATWGCRDEDDDYEFDIRLLRAASEGRTWYEKISGAGFRARLPTISSQKRYYDLARDYDQSCRYPYNNCGRQSLCWRSSETVLNDGRKVPYYFNMASAESSWEWPPVTTQIPSTRFTGIMNDDTTAIDDHVKDYWHAVGSEQRKTVRGMSVDIQSALKIIDKNRSPESFRHLKQTNFWRPDWEDMNDGPTDEHWQSVCKMVYSVFERTFCMPDGYNAEKQKYAYTFAKQYAIHLKNYYYWVTFSMFRPVEDEYDGETPDEMSLDEYRELCERENGADSIAANMAKDIPSDGLGLPFGEKVALYKSSGAKDVSLQRPFEALVALIEEEQKRTPVVTDVSPMLAMASDETRKPEFEKCKEDMRVHMESELLTLKEMERAYGLYKQATEGDCTIEAPSWVRFRARKKYDAWMAVKGTPKEVAQMEYCQLSAMISRRE